MRVFQFVRSFDVCFHDIEHSSVVVIRRHKDERRQLAIQMFRQTRSVDELRQLINVLDEVNFTLYDGIEPRPNQQPTTVENPRSVDDQRHSK